MHRSRLATHESNFLTRDVMPPPHLQGSSLQFRWDHYEYLCREVLKKLDIPYHERYYATFKRNALMYAQGLVLDMRVQHKLSQSCTWEHLSKQSKLEAEGMYEKLVGKEYPLVACVESWGATLMMRKAFWSLKDKTALTL
ncbi:hypothetical protein BJV82DRAFT_364527 [Fennellomyces sp. T-0311]|nr:hypothetical protein BJV82DRAFT_364527 [Fennellomyces sp. T-0311]